MSTNPTAKFVKVVKRSEIAGIDSIVRRHTIGLLRMMRLNYPKEFELVAKEEITRIEKSLAKAQDIV